MTKDWSARKGCMALSTESWFGTLLIKNGTHYSRRDSDKEVPYIVVADQAPPAEIAVILEHILRDQYKDSYQNPSLLINVTGGAQAFSLKPLLLSRIKRGIVRAALARRAWVMTGGSNSGVMKLIGEAIGDAKSTQPIPLIGIMSFAIFDKRQDVSQGDSSSRLGMPYSSTSYKSADQNHSQMIFVDDGKEGLFGGEIEFVSSLQREVRQRFDIQLVTIVIQGGPGTIDASFRAAESDSPLVVVEDSGKAADLLAFAWHILHDDEKWNHGTMEWLATKVQQTFDLPVTSPNIEIFCEKLMSAMENVEKVVLYSVIDEDAIGFDEAILEAAFKTQTRNLTKSIEHALDTDRIDLARTALLERKRGDPEVEKQLNHCLFLALMKGSIDFVDLLLDNDASPSKIWADTNEELTTDIQRFQHAVEALYSKPALDSQAHLGRLIVEEPAGPAEKMFSLRRFERLASRYAGVNVAVVMRSDDDISTRETAAIQVLFIWAVLSNYERLAGIFWIRGTNHLSNAIIAAGLLRKMESSVFLVPSNFADDRAKMRSFATNFETHAIGVLQRCYDSAPEKVDEMIFLPVKQSYSSNHILFHRKPKTRCCVELAHKASCLRFMSHQATQAAVNQRWYGDVSPSTPHFMVILAIVFPFLLYFVQFNAKKVALKAPTKVFRGSEAHNDADEKEDWLTWLSNSHFARFHRAPLIKYWIDFMLYMMFIGIHTYVTLEKFSNTIQPIEYVLFIWFFALLVEEVKQFLEVGYSEWRQVIWNQLDAVILCVYFLSFTIRAIGPSQFINQEDAKVVMAINSIFLALRIGHYYAISQHIGPKVIMVIKLFQDLMYFLTILVLFWFGFGTAHSAILYTTGRADGRAVFEIFYKGVYWMYGRDFLDESLADSSCAGALNWSSCGYSRHWLIPILTAVDLILVQTLMINLLIAIFTSSFQRLEDLSQQLWNNQYFELFTEYGFQGFLNGPLVLFSIAGQMLYKCFSRSNRVVPQNVFFSHKKHVALEDLFEKSNLGLFEETNAEQYMKEIRQQEYNSQVQRLERIGVSLSAAMRVIKDIHSHQQAEDVASLTMDAPSSRIKSGYQRQASMAPHKALSMHILRKKHKGCGVHHGEVPEDRRSWNVPFPGYSPIMYNEEPSSPNAADLTGSTRKGFVADLKVNMSLHKNPFGRTGAAGLGVLPFFGANQSVCVVLTRFKRGANGRVILRGGKPIMECLALQQADKSWELPAIIADSAHMDPEQSILTAFESSFIGFELHQEVKGRKLPFGQLLDLAFEKCEQRRVHTDYYTHDHRNTDNAWVNSVVISLHDNKGSLFNALEKITPDSDLEGRPTTPSLRGSWKPVHRYQNNLMPYYDFLEPVVSTYNAFF